jgi:hypothetical protein
LLDAFSILPVSGEAVEHRARITNAPGPIARTEGVELFG